MKRLFFLLPLLSFLAVTAQDNQTIRAFKAEKLYVQGLQLYQNGNVRGAIETFDQVIALDRNHGQVYQAKGDAYFELGDFDKAIESYAIAAQQYPNNASIRNSMGVSAASMTMYRAAESYFLEALQIDPAYAAAKRNLEKTQLLLREGNNGPTSNPWDEPPVRPSSTITTTVPSTWGTPWPSTEPGGTASGYPPSSDPWNSSSGGTTDPIWNTGFRPTGTVNSDPLPATPVRGTPLNPWEREDRNSRQTIYSRERGQVNVTYRTDPFVNIEQVRITENSTLVSFTVQSISKDPFPISLAGVGSPEALMITDRQFGRAYRLKNIRLEGWPIEPYELRPGETKMIIAEFERIPADLHFFHIVEGEIPSQGSWDFYDVELVDTP